MLAARSRRTSAIATLASIALLVVVAGPVAAAEPAFEADFPAGLACADFDLHVAGYGTGSQVVREFVGKDGEILNLVAGTGYALTFTNPANDATLALQSNGSVGWTATRADGTQKMNLMGHNVVILFPSDGGPSTTLYAGRTVIDVAANGVWTVTKVAGTATDICAALS